MREAVGTTWIFQLVLIFILIFAAYLALTINYSKAFKVKNETLTIIEKHEGLTYNAMPVINNYLKSSGYNQTGKCPSGWYGIKSLDDSINSSLEDAQSNKKYYWCIYKVAGYHTSMPGRAYYKIRMFFRFDLPVIGPITTFNVDGQTYEMDNSYDNL